MRLAGSLWPFWEARGHLGKGRRWLEEALARDPRHSEPSRVKALAGVAWLALLQGDFGRLTAAYEEGLNLGAHAAPASTEKVILLVARGVAAREQGNAEEATALLEKGLAKSQAAGDRWGAALSLLNLGALWSNRGDYERAIAALEEGLASSRDLGDPALLANYLIGLGYEYLLRRDHERATALSEEAAALLRAQGHRTGLDLALDTLGWAALLRGDDEAAKELLAESLRLGEEMGSGTVTPESLEGLACVAGSQGEDARAARLFGAAEALRELTGALVYPPARALREPHLRSGRSRLGDPAWVRGWEEGLTMSREEAVAYALGERRK